MRSTAARVRRTCDAEVADERVDRQRFARVAGGAALPCSLAAGEQNVLRLDVAMDHAVRVRVGEGVRDLTGDAKRLRRIDATALRSSRARSDSPTTSGMT